MVQLRSRRSVNNQGDNKQLHLVTGGAGYAGYQLGLALLERGHNVKLTDIREPDGDIPQGMIFAKCDIRDYLAVEATLQRAYCVYHMASYGMSGREQLNKQLIERVNVTGTENIIKACLKLNIHHLVYTSTYNVVFGGQKIENGDESLPYLPLDQHPDNYSRTKALAEMCVLKASGTVSSDGHVLHTCALRLAGVYGPGEQRHLPRIVNYIEKGIFRITYGDKDSLVDFLHVDNLVQAHIKAGEALTENRKHIASGEAYFISDSKPVNNFEFFRPLVEGLGYQFPTFVLPLTMVYFFAFLTEMIHHIVRGIYNFQPLLTRAEVYKTGVTHYFSNAKSHRHFGYMATKQNDMASVLKWYLDRGYYKKNKQNSVLVRFLRDLVIAVIFAAIILSCIPFVR